VVLENGKNKAEALASVAKGNETVEWACSMPQIAQVGHVVMVTRCTYAENVGPFCQGKILHVSRGVTCVDHREPLGVVASIVPFNFPIMVPMWTIPIALAAGNCVILKPSEKVLHEPPAAVLVEAFTSRWVRGLARCR
jgi:malonate-semialdehyde dehydrogenase (acetylating) / methylmalonate-semialdehyde dehydrogenase